MKQMAKNTACVALGVYLAVLMVWGTQAAIHIMTPAEQVAEAVDR